MTPLPVVAAWLGIAHFGWGLIWCWVVITAWICTLALIYLARFLQGRWRKMRVIEPPADVAPAPRERQESAEPAVALSVDVS